MARIRVTLDTGVLPADDLVNSAAARGIELAIATVTERETTSTSFSVGLQPLTRIVETAVWDESEWDRALFDCENESEELESILKVVSNGSFPKPGARKGLTTPQRSQLRDAMILCAHVSDRRDIFVTTDAKAFIGHGRQVEFESRYNTSIMTRVQFERYVASLPAI